MIFYSCIMGWNNLLLGMNSWVELNVPFAKDKGVHFCVDEKGDGYLYGSGMSSGLFDLSKYCGGTMHLFGLVLGEGRITYCSFPKERMGKIKMELKEYLSRWYADEYNPGQFRLLEKK